MKRRETGFSLVELLVATTLTACIAAAVFAAVRPVEGVFSVQSEAADMQQRLRVAATALARDIDMAGAGLDGADAGSLIEWFPPVLPYRPARTGGDAAGTFRHDAITVIYVPSQSAQAVTSSAVPSASADVQVDIGPGCPITDAACGFSGAETAILFDTTGSFDRFTIARVDGPLLVLQHTFPDSSKVYAAGSRIVGAVSRSFFLEADGRRSISRLIRDDGDGVRVPVVDNVVALTFEYFGEPRPPNRPLPPEPSQQTTSYPPGENCLFARDAAANAVPRLALLGATASDGLSRLDASQLTDGPWCPDSGAANRFDADLLRIRRIAVTLRVESAVDALRGPAGPLFSRSGTAVVGNRYVPDQSVQFEMFPRNLSLGR